VEKGQERGGKEGEETECELVEAPQKYGNEKKKFEGKLEA